MLLQYPRLSSEAAIAHYKDYRKVHHDFMKVYRGLYNDVRSFACLPEKFIQEAEPVIDKYLHKTANGNEQRLGLQVIGDFINNFYVFTDEATEMFTEHQALAGQTMRYLERVAYLNRKNKNLYVSDCEDDYLQLIPHLTALQDHVSLVKDKVEQTDITLNKLKPVWERIKVKIAE